MPRRRFACCLAVLVASAVLSCWCPAIGGEPFPFGSELMLDVAPMHGSKRVPMLEIEDDGSASIDLWCASCARRPLSATVRSRIVAGRRCRRNARRSASAGDADLLAALSR